METSNLIKDRFIRTFGERGEIYSNEDWDIAFQSYQNGWKQYETLEDAFVELRLHSRELVILVCEALHIDRLADWLESKLSK